MTQTQTQTRARHRAFSFQRGTTDDTAPEELGPPTFDIGNQTDIRCVDSMDGFRLLVFTGMMGRGVSATARAQAMTEFIEDAIVPEDFERFLQGCKEGGVDIEGVGEICGWLSDVYAERPTKSAEPSSAGQTSTGSSSAVSSSSAASTGVGSPPPTS